MAAAWGRRPHEIAGYERQPGDAVRCYLFDLVCMLSWAKEEARAIKMAEAKAALAGGALKR